MYFFAPGTAVSMLKSNGDLYVTFSLVNKIGVNFFYYQPSLHYALFVIELHIYELFHCLILQFTLFNVIYEFVYRSQHFKAFVAE